MAESITTTNWVMLLLGEILPDLQAEWMVHRTQAPGMFLVFTSVSTPPRRVHDITVAWIARSAKAVRTLLARLPEPRRVQAFLDETPADLTVVALVCERRVSLYRLSLPEGHMVLVQESS